jgi:phosphatidylinositol glycan class B
LKLRFSEKTRVIPTLSAALMLLLAFTSVGWYHPDEHFQILEFAGLKLGLTSPQHLPWEYPAMMRSAIQPAMVVALHQVMAVFGITSPFAVTFVLRILSAILTFTAMWMMYRRYAPEIADPVLKKWFLPLSFLVWFALYNGVRFSSETWSGGVFIIGFTYLDQLKRSPGAGDFLFTGFLLGLSFVIRFQTGLLVAGFFCWFVYCGKQGLLKLGSMASGIVLAFAAGIGIDRWYYGTWTCSAWNYFRLNILQDKISGFGIEPWYYYFQDIFIQAIPPFSLVFIASFLVLIIFRRRDLLTWTLVPFILIHFVITHKETRFLYPLIGFVPVVLILSVETASARWKKGLTGNAVFRGFARAFWIVNLLFILVAVLYPADHLVRMYRHIYNGYPGQVTLLYVNKSPFQRALDVRYYRRSEIRIAEADSSVMMNPPKGTTYLLAFDNRDRGSAPYIDRIVNKRVVWSSYPEWVRVFNFNGWIDRSAFWYLYEVRN